MVGILEDGEKDILQYGDLQDLQNKDNHVLIKVEACALNHLDVWIRKGWPGLNLEMPHIGGSEVSGTVEEGSGQWKDGDKGKPLKSGSFLFDNKIHELNKKEIMKGLVLFGSQSDKIYFE